MSLHRFSLDSTIAFGHTVVDERRAGRPRSTRHPAGSRSHSRAGFGESRMEPSTPLADAVPGMGLAQRGGPSEGHGDAHAAAEARGAAPDRAARSAPDRIQSHGHAAAAV